MTPNETKRLDNAAELERVATILESQRQVILEMANELHVIAEDRAADLYGIASQWSKLIGLRRGSAAGITHGLPNEDTS